MKIKIKIVNENSPKLRRKLISLGYYKEIVAAQVIEENDFLFLLLPFSIMGVGKKSFLEDTAYRETTLADFYKMYPIVKDGDWVVEINGDHCNIFKAKKIDGTEDTFQNPLFDWVTYQSSDLVKLSKSEIETVESIMKKRSSSF